MARSKAFMASVNTMLRHMSTGREAPGQRSLLNFLCMGDQEKRISAKPLFERFDAEKGAAAQFAKRLNTAQGRIANWRSRGIPAAMVPEVAAYLGMKTDEYLERVGRVPPRSETSAAIQFESDSPQITRLVKAFAWLMDDEQKKLLADLEAKAATNKTIAKELGPRFRIKPDQEMLEHLKRGGDFPPGTKKKAARSRQPKRGGYREEDPE